MAILRMWTPSAGETCEAMSPNDLFTVGRRPSNKIVITDPRVSADHLRFALDEDGSCSVVDLSTNGSYLNGKPLVKQARTPLSAGDVPHAPLMPRPCCMASSSCK